MSLDYQLGKIENFEALCFHHKKNRPCDSKHRDGMNAVTETLIFATMSVDLGGIDASNIREWVWRLAFLQKIGYGDQLVQQVPTPNKGRGMTETVERTYTREELQAHIGLSTNVIDKPRAAFVKRWVEALKDAADREVRDVFKLDGGDGAGAPISERVKQQASDDYDKEVAAAMKRVKKT